MLLADVKDYNKYASYVCLFFVSGCIFEFNPLYDAQQNKTQECAGGCILDKWCADCTHLIVEDGAYVTDVVIQAVAEKKPVVGTAWIEVLILRMSMLSC